MQTFRFSFNGEHELILPDGELAICCAADIVEGHSYPFPINANPKVVVDIGAHVGEFTIMSALLWPKATIHAFEPFPPICEVLRHNLRDFKNVVIHESAVDASGSAPRKLHLSSYGTVCHSLYPEIMLTSTHESIDVAITSPSEIAALAPDILKIDAEGAEFGILFGMPFAVTAAIERIHVEFHRECDRQELCAFLDKTHSLAYARICHANQGELMYVRR